MIWFILLKLCLNNGKSKKLYILLISGIGLEHKSSYLINKTLSLTGNKKIPNMSNELRTQSMHSRSAKLPRSLRSSRQTRKSLSSRIGKSV